MRQFSGAVLLWMLLQTLMSPAAIARDAVPAEPVAVSASVAASATNVNADSVTPKINDMKIDIATACAIPTYPEAALRYGMQGDTVLKLMIDESGKIKAFQLVRSSGWKMLDLTVMNAIIGCQILPEGRWVPSETYTAYRWKFDQGYTSPAVLEAKTASPQTNCASPMTEIIKIKMRASSSVFIRLKQEKCWMPKCSGAVTMNNSIRKACASPDHVNSCPPNAAASVFATPVHCASLRSNLIQVTYFAYEYVTASPNKTAAAGMKMCREPQFY
jgi:TonB family protein